MELGIFAKIYSRNSLEDVLDAVVADGFTTVQFNMACTGLGSMPMEIDDQTIIGIREKLDSHKLHICALSATFNTIHPDLHERASGIQHFKVLAESARSMGTDLLTLCTGTRNRDSKWMYHPDNGTPEAWADLIDTLSQLIDIAEEYNLRLGIEPEINNVIDSSEKARLLLDELKSPRLVIIMDPSNIFRYHDLPKMDSILKRSFDLLEPFIALAHCKDVSNVDPPIYGAAGTGVLNYALYIKLLREINYQGPLIFHSLSEQQIPASVDYVKSFLPDKQ